MLILREYGPSMDVNVYPPDEYIRQKGYCLDQKEYRVRTDRNGFILSGSDSAAQSDVFIALGDSVCECLYVEEEKRIWAQLEERLTRRGKAVTVLNGGASDCHLLHIINVFFHKVIPLRPRGVIIMQGGGDRQPGVDKASYWSSSPAITAFRRRPGQEPFDPQKAVRAFDGSDRLRLLHILHCMAVQFAIPITFATNPLPRHWPEGWHHLSETLNDQTRRFCYENGVPLVDLEKDVAGFGWLFYDDAHLNRVGCEVVAECILAAAPAGLLS